MSQRGALDTQSKPGRGAGAVEALAFVVIDGELYVASEDAEGYATDEDEDGWVLVDTEATEGMRVVKTPTQILAYS